MEQPNFTHTDTEYQALSDAVSAAGIQATADYIRRNPDDRGGCGWAFIVMDDKKAARRLPKVSKFQKYHGIGVALRVTCANQQSLQGAEYVAEAMAEEFRVHGLPVHVIGMAD